MKVNDPVSSSPALSLSNSSFLRPKPRSEGYLSGASAWISLSLLFFVSMLSQVDRILPFILAESIKRDLGLNDTELGLVTGVAFAVCYCLMSLPLARSADRRSPRLVLIVCIVVWSAMTSLGGLAASLLFLAFTRFGVAFGESGGIPAGHALIARQIAPARRGLAIAIFSLGIPLGTMLGFGLGGRINDTLGWRAALVGAGAIGLVLATLVTLVIRPTPPLEAASTAEEPFLQSSLRLLSRPAFLWMFIAGNVVAFASSPFYAFATPFLIRTHGFTASEAGLAFGLPQGLLGIAGMVLGGRGFDRAVQSGRGRLLFVPAVVFLVAAFTTLGALFAPAGWMAVALFTPAMFSFAFMLPWAFGTGHLVAGDGKQALASSLLMIGTGLLGPTLGPLLVGVVSDAATAAQLSDGLRLGMVVVPVASLLSGLAMLVADQRVAAALGRR